MPHSPEDKKRILTRVRRIRGQAEALERALEAGEPCLHILQQIAAVRGAANSLKRSAGQRRHHAGAARAADGGNRPAFARLSKITTTTHYNGRTL